MYEIPIGKAFIRKSGNDITLISSSYTSFLCETAAYELKNKGIDVEFIDLCSLKPYDKNTILSSVSKTGRAVIVDGSWKSFGYAAEISAMISENLFGQLKSPIERVCLPDSPAPASRTLEENYYITKEKIIEGINKTLNYTE